MRLKATWSALALAACTHGAEPAAQASAPQLTAASEPSPSASAAEEASAPQSSPTVAAAPSALPSVSATPLPTPAPSPPVASISHRKTARCQRDDQCAIEQDHNCCGECFSLPIAAIGAAADRKARAERARHCAVEDHDCSKFSCTGIPDKCRVHAVCAKGWCEVAASKECEGGG